MIYFIADQNAKGHVTLKINTIASTFPLRLTRLFKFSFLMPKGRVMQVSFNWYRIYWLVKFNQKKRMMLFFLKYIWMHPFHSLFLHLPHCCILPGLKPPAIEIQVQVLPPIFSAYHHRSIFITKISVYHHQQLFFNNK